MRRIISVILAAALCLSAAAQESHLLQEWEEQTSLSDESFLSCFGHLSFFYNHNLGAPEGMMQPGFGFEASILHVGFSPWKNARFSLGLVDFCIDNLYLQNGWGFDQNNAITSTPGKDNMSARRANLAMMFPLGYIQAFKGSKWSVGLFAAPGVGWSRYVNQYVQDNIKHKEESWMARGGAYFRLNLEAAVWYNHTGMMVRYIFPPQFQGAGILSAGLSFRI